MGNDGVLEGSVIQVRLPPSLRFASVIRVVAASLAADEDFSITALAEFRTAVQEAFEVVLEQTVPDERDDADTALDVRFMVSPGCVRVEFSVASDGQRFAGESPSHRAEPSADGLVIENGRVTLTRQVPRGTSDSVR
jgi:hypothetical protein